MSFLLAALIRYLVIVIYCAEMFLCFAEGEKRLKRITVVIFLLLCDYSLFRTLTYLILRKHALLAKTLRQNLSKASAACF